MPGFCIDESTFLNVTDLPEKISQFINQLNTIHTQHQQHIYKSAKLDYIQITEGVDFCDFLYNYNYNIIDRDTLKLLAISLDRCIVWDADGFEIPHKNIIFNNQPPSCDSIKFVVSKAISNIAVGILSLCSSDACACSASADSHKTTIFHIGSSNHFELFYRFQLIFEKVSRNDFSKWSTLAFPRLRFALEISDQLRKFHQNYDQILDQIIEHLAVINDDFISLLISETQPSEICSRIKSKYGIEISPESPSTHRNQRAMKEREVKFNGKIFTCEFHSKLKPQYDRIHFSIEICSDFDGSKYLVVGPFAEHLTT